MAMSTTYCDDCNKTHTSLMCFNKPRKPIRQISKVGLQWIKKRQQWLRDNPPDNHGYYFCYICSKPLTSLNVTLDHIQPRSRRPDLRLETSNLAPCCWSCNHKKGSKPLHKINSEVAKKYDKNY